MVAVPRRDRYWGSVQIADIGSTGRLRGELLVQVVRGSAAVAIIIIWNLVNAADYSEQFRCLGGP